MTEISLVLEPGTCSIPQTVCRGYSCQVEKVQDSATDWKKNYMVMVVTVGFSLIGAIPVMPAVLVLVGNIEEAAKRKENVDPHP